MCLYEQTALETSVQLSAVIKEKDDLAVDKQLKMKDRVVVFFFFLHGRNILLFAKSDIFFD